MSEESDAAHARLPERLNRLYGPQTGDAVWSRLAPRLEAARKEFGEMEGDRWSQRDAFLITYGDSVCAKGEVPLQTLARFVRERLGNAVSLVHVLPFFPYTSDDGFSISDYEAVRPDLGDWSDMEALHASHDLMYDLVLNHCSVSHAWFQEFLADETPGNGFFHVPPPDADLRDVVRPRTHPLLTPFETARRPEKVWTTFSPDQVDLNFSNPDVLLTFLDVLLLYVRRGARMIRLDAIAFLWKEPGTDCIHLPQTHEVVKVMRDVLEVAAPHVVLLTETNVPHKENISYFGGGDEARMVYQFPLPPLLLASLRMGSAEPLTKWAAALEAPPEGCAFFNFTASHDGVGVRPLEGLVPEEDVVALAESIRAGGGRVGERSRPDGSTSPYELNATYFSALRLPTDDDETHLRRFNLSQTVPLCLQGIPAVYFHSFTATPNDLQGMERTGRNRSINRKQWELTELNALLDDPATPAARTLAMLTERLRIRSEIPSFHPDVPQRILEVDPQVFAVCRQEITALHNFGPEPVEIQVEGDRLVMADEGVRLTEGRCLLPALSVAWIQ